jgi:hypothetical protein
MHKQKWYNKLCCQKLCVSNTKLKKLDTKKVFLDQINFARSKIGFTEVSQDD